MNMRPLHDRIIVHRFEDDVLAVIEGRPKQTASVLSSTSTILKKKAVNHGDSGPS